MPRLYICSNGVELRCGTKKSAVFGPNMPKATKYCIEDVSPELHEVLSNMISNRKNYEEHRATISTLLYGILSLKAIHNS